MPELKRTIRCSNCSTESSFYLSTDIATHELQFLGRCQNCGNSLQITFSIVESGTSGQSTSSTGTGSSQDINLDTSMFEPELPSDAIKDLIED